MQRSKNKPGTDLELWLRLHLPHVLSEWIIWVFLVWRYLDLSLYSWKRVLTAVHCRPELILGFFCYDGNQEHIFPPGIQYGHSYFLKPWVQAQTSQVTHLCSSCNVVRCTFVFTIPSIAVVALFTNHHFNLVPPCNQRQQTCYMSCSKFKFYIFRNMGDQCFPTESPGVPKWTFIYFNVWNWIITNHNPNFYRNHY